MGSRRSGKSSIAHVVFHKMPPHETFFMEGTNSLDIKYVANNALVQFQIWDFPGDFEFLSAQQPPLPPLQQQEFQQQQQLQQDMGNAYAQEQAMQYSYEGQAMLQQQQQQQHSAVAASSLNPPGMIASQLSQDSALASITPEVAFGGQHTALVYVVRVPSIFTYSYH